MSIESETKSLEIMLTISLITPIIRSRDVLRIIFVLHIISLVAMPQVKF